MKNRKSIMPGVISKVNGTYFQPEGCASWYQMAGDATPVIGEKVVIWEGKGIMYYENTGRHL